MINLSINLFNPWTRQKSYKELWQRHIFFEGKPKHIDIGFYRHTGLLLDFSLSWTHRQDHAGFVFSIGLLGFYGDIHVFDERHWDSENNSWVNHS